MVYLQSPLELELQLTDEQFFELCQKHRNLKFERNATGDLIIMSPTGGITSDRNSDINFQLRAWNRDRKLGKVFESSGGFKLPNGADRSLDASWVKLQRWNALTLEQQAKLVPLCPDFVVELRSPSDALSKVQQKMNEYIENGAELGWLIDPKRQVVEVYRPSQDAEVLQSPKTVSGEAVLPGFVLDLTEIFS
ncbi:MAG: Uma2 family endonuclease [Hormoscilla sp.]